jgi:hypothetical protein
MLKISRKDPRKKVINDDETWMWKRKMNIGTWNVRSLFCLTTIG